MQQYEILICVRKLNVTDASVFPYYNKNSLDVCETLKPDSSNRDEEM